MAKTSFGHMDILLKDGNRPLMEYLVFEKEGRPHKHKEEETFFVVLGKGIVVNGDKRIPVEAYDKVVIPANTSHWMIPEGESPLVGFLWYN